MLVCTVEGFEGTVVSGNNVYSYSKQILDLSENEIKELDQGLQGLVSLREMNFSKNQLMTLPTFWGHFTSLVVLNLGE